MHALSIVANRTILQSLTRNKNNHKKKTKWKMVFSTKRGGELGVGGLFIMQQLEQERAVALKKEIIKYKNELNNIKMNKLLTESKNTITDNNNADVES